MAFLDHPRYRFDDTKLNKLILKMYFNTWIEEFRFNISQLQPYFNQFGSALRENWPSERDLGDFKWVWILFQQKGMKMNSKKSTVCWAVSNDFRKCKNGICGQNDPFR